MPESETSALSQSETAKIWGGLALCLLMAAGALGLAWLTSAAPVKDPVVPKPQVDEVAQPAPEVEDPLSHSVDEVFIGRDYDNNPRKRQTLMTTRQGGTTFQVLIRYQEKPVDLKDVPGVAEIINQATLQGKQLPNTIYRIDEETEQFSKNLGQSVRFMTSYHAYIDPTDFRVIAYDLAQTTGGIPQRYVGFRTSKGVKVVVYRGNDRIDQHEITFDSGDTFMPMDFGFIHRAFSADPEALARRVEKHRHVFLPGQIATVALFAKPMGDEVIPIGNLTYLCARYRVRVQSAGFADGPRAYQDMWFNKNTGEMMRREDVEVSLKPGEAPVTEVAPLDTLEQTLSKLRERVLRPPVLPEKPFPYLMDTELTYNVRARDSDVGRVRIRFEPVNKSDNGVFVGHGSVNMSPGSHARHETAVTFFDDKFNAIKYSAEGDEAGEVVAEYKLSALHRKNTIAVDMQRQLKPRPEAGQPAEPAADAGQENKPVPALVQEYKDPLKRVSIEEDDATSEELAALPPVTTFAHTRPLSDGTCLYDFNRLEHLAAIAYRFPMPPSPKDDQPVTSTYQKVGLYCVRQNRADIVQFEIRPEIKPKLTERQLRRLDPRDRNEPQLYFATSTHSLLNCRMLLTGEGRILQLTINQGTGDVTYTLDDPIMNRRAELARKQRMQEGPQLLRPPWW